MGKLFKSWFKKKKKQGSIHSISSPHKKKTIGDIDYAPSTQQQKQIHAKNRSEDEALSLANGGTSISLLDDVLGGWSDHGNDGTKVVEGIYAPDLPPSSTSTNHRQFLSKSRTLTDGQFQHHHQHQHQHQSPIPAHQQQYQPKNRIISGFSENNGSSIYQQNMTQTPPTCRMAPETPGYSPCPPPSSASTSTQDSSVIATPSSATTPSLPLNKKSSSPLPLFASSSSPALLTQSDQLISNSSHYGGTTSAGVQSDTLTTVDKNTSRSKAMGQQSQLLHQDQPILNTPSITCDDDNNKDKRNRYLQAAGVSMTRMKERHRLECRRSMQPNSNQLAITSPSPQVEKTQAPLTSSPSSPHLSIQRTQQTIPNQTPNRPFLPSPSMPALNHLEHMSQPIASTGTKFASTSFSQLMPSVVRSSSMMADLHQLPSSTSGFTTAVYSGPTSRINGINTATSSAMDQESSQHWRQHTLFPYQSDIVLPPYNPAQLSTIHQQPQGPIMMIPQSTSYRILNNNNNSNNRQAFPRSASVYGGQYHQQGQNDRMMTTYGSSGYLLRSTMMADSNLQLGMINSGAQQRHQQRKSMSAMPRSYKPQLSLSNSPSTQSQLYIKKSKRYSECIGAPDDPTIPLIETPEDTIMELPASFLPSSFSPSSNLKLTPVPTSGEASSSSSDDSSQSLSTSTSLKPQRQPSISSSPKPAAGSNSEDNNNQEDEEAAPLDPSGKISHRSNTLSTSSSASRQSDTSAKNKGNSGLDEKLEIPSLVDHLPTKLQQQTELRIMAKQHRQTRRRRRFSLPTVPTMSPSSSTSSISSVVEKEKQQGASVKTALDTEYTDTKVQTDQPHEKIYSTNHASCNSDGHQHHQHLCRESPAPACSISTSRIPSSHDNGSSWSPTCHTCKQSSAPLAICCPPSSTPSYHGSYPICSSHQSSIPVAATPPSCCPPPNYPPTCCSRSHHHHRHHHCNHSQHRCHHRSSAMKKSSSMAIADPKSKLRQKGQKRQQEQQAMEDSSNQSDDDTITEVPISPPKNPTSSYSLQRPSFRSFLPRAPRFSTSIPRLQQQQQQQPKAVTSKSSYSWIPSRS